MTTPEAELPIPGATRRTLARVLLRLRGASVTTAGWKLELESPQGPGAIVLTEGGPVSWYRGEGVCLGLGQERLGELWAALQPPAEREQETVQWG